MPLTPKNWTSFQHYKDRAPAWIKLHRGLLDNIEYYRLSPEAGKALPLVWLLASERDGIVPEAAELSFRLRVSEDLAADILTELVEREFLVGSEAKTAEHGATLAQRTAKSNGFGSRHISDATKREAWDRDEGKCQKCGSCEDIEYDHIHPVSKGGNSELENIQLLCRPCNRSKRVSVATHAEHVGSASRSLEKRERREEREKKPRAASPSKDENFEEFKRDYPKRAGNYGWKAAERKYLALVKTGVDPAAINAANRRHAEDMRKLNRIGTEFVPMPASWLNSEDFVECAVVAFEPKPIDWDALVKGYQTFGKWPTRDVGNDPSSPACRAPPEILRKYGFEPVIPALRAM